MMRRGFVAIKLERLAKSIVTTHASLHFISPFVALFFKMTSYLAKKEKE